MNIYLFIHIFTHKYSMQCISSKHHIFIRNIYMQCNGCSFPQQVNNKVSLPYKTFLFWCRCCRRNSFPFKNSTFIIYPQSMTKIWRIYVCIHFLEQSFLFSSPPFPRTSSHSIPSYPPSSTHLGYLKRYVQS